MAAWTLASCLAMVLGWPLVSCFPQTDGLLRFPPVANASRPFLPVFPDHFVPATDREGNPLCKKRSKDTFCEKVDDYPRDFIMKSINYSPKEFRKLFGESQSPSLTRKARPGDPTEVPICQQRTRVFYPKAAENDNGDWSFIVNGNDVEGEYVQAVMAELCESSAAECDYLERVLPHGMSSRCVQKYAYKRLLALHPKEHRTHTDNFKFPSCCVCMVAKPYLSAATLFRSAAEKPTTRGDTS